MTAIYIMYRIRHVIYYNLHICFVAVQCNVPLGQNMYGNVILCQMITPDTDLHIMWVIALILETYVALYHNQG